MPALDRANLRKGKWTVSAAWSVSARGGVAGLTKPYVPDHGHAKALTTDPMQTRLQHEEEEYTQSIIDYFNMGLLPLPEGTTLRAYLAEKLKW